jgi:uncharacterized membrane protein (UPF0127 family)
LTNLGANRFNAKYLAAKANPSNQSMQRSGQSSCQVPIALSILLLVAAAVFCFAGAVAVGIGCFYFLESTLTGHLGEVTPAPSPELELSPTPPNTPAPKSTASITPFRAITPFKAITPAPSGALDEFGFPTTKIQLGARTLEVELAETQEQQLKGLRFRKSLADNAGMLFIFPSPQRASFWMKDASIPLSIAFIEADGKIVQIRPMQPFDKTPVPSLSDSIAYALMVNQGWFERNGIPAGTVIENLPKAQ